ncbi:MAG: GGDEF domain-containing response regulator [Betaproteobacteria bacterium]
MHADARRRVLVVDDSKFVRTTFRSILSPSFTVLEEADGEAAWDVVSRDPSVVIVFTDLDMPKLDGFGLLERIRASSDARLRAMPVAIITGDEQAATKRRAREAGASSFISKSADAREVMTRIDRLLKMVRPVPAPVRTSIPGLLSTRGLMSEGQRHYALARRSATELSVMALRIDSYAELSRQAGAEVAEQLLGQIAKVVLGALRSGDALGRTAPDTFVLLAPGAAAAHIGSVAGRLRGQLESAQVGYRGKPLRIACSFGLASAANDGGATSIEDLVGLAVQRLRVAHAPPAARPQPQPQPFNFQSPGSNLPAELERALRYFESLDVARLGSAADEFARRLKRIAKSIQAKRR